ncbi:MAG: hypothetical protein WEH44_02340 [Pirellulaceae bacterium]
MRTGPFSQKAVIEKLNACFVPVYLSQEELGEDGDALATDEQDYRRMIRAAGERGLSTGTVHAFVLAPDRQPLDSLHVAEAAKTKTLLAMLDRAIATLKIEAGKPLAAPRPQSCAPDCQRGSLVLHLTSRPLSGGGSWDGISENWIVYKPSELALLLPPDKPIVVGMTWKIDEKLATRLLTHFYPVTENNDVTKNQILEQSLTGRVLSIDGNRVLARLDGRLKMRHNFYYKDEGNTVEATLVGYIEFESGERPQIKSLKLATRQATYGGGEFGVAVTNTAASTE